MGLKWILFHVVVWQGVLECSDTSLTDEEGAGKR